ncbi:hypothetical protein GQ600_11947 [Phytophthora cactorum]|nr:hypothetical protein GQ600_11947 [Phytophthora cactorum]
MSALGSTLVMVLDIAGANCVSSHIVWVDDECPLSEASTTSNEKLVRGGTAIFCSCCSKWLSISKDDDELIDHRSTWTRRRLRGRQGP